MSIILMNSNNKKIDVEIEMWELKDFIESELIDEGCYSTFLGDTDILLGCENYCREYHLTAKNKSLDEMVDFKIVSLTTAIDILAAAKLCLMKWNYYNDDFKPFASGLTEDMTKEVREYVFIGDSIKI